MLRAALAALVLVAFTPAALAGEKCIQRPAPVFWDGALDLHEDGKWHRDGAGGGRISGAAVARFEALQASGATHPALVKCLEALIKNEKSKAAKRACKVPKKKRA
jgi:hypothetical protein